MTDQSMKPKTQGDEFLDVEQAAARAGLALTYFRGLVRRGKGPPSLRPSRYVRLYTVEDVDTWRKSWGQ